MALAKTGTGKTLAFGLPLLQLINTEKSAVQVLILAPTRELSQQIYSNLTEYGSQNPAIKVTVVSGGIPIKPQIERLKTRISYCSCYTRSDIRFNKPWCHFS